MIRNLYPNIASDFPANTQEKEGYKLEFCDDFEGETLNPKNWLPYYLPQWSSQEKTRARYSLQNNQLQLHIEETQAPWSPEYNGDIRVSSLQTGCFSGPLGSKRGQHPFRKDLVVKEQQPVVKLYTPTYGYFETRLKAVALPSYVCALWMIGFEDTPHRSAEICLVEIKGEHIHAQHSLIGYGLHPFNDPNIKDEFYEEKFNIDASQFHIYAVDWTPECIHFYIDSIKIRTIFQSPDYPMQFMLNIYELQRKPGTSYPQTMIVDYVRGYRKQ